MEEIAQGGRRLTAERLPALRLQIRLLLALAAHVDAHRDVDELVDRLLPMPDARTALEAAAPPQRCRRVARWLKRDGFLGAGWRIEHATDIVWSLTSAQTYDQLVGERDLSIEH